LLFILIFNSTVLRLTMFCVLFVFVLLRKLYKSLLMMTTLTWA